MNSLAISLEEECMLTPCDIYITQEHYDDCLLTIEDESPCDDNSFVDTWLLLQIAELDKDSDIATF